MNRINQVTPEGSLTYAQNTNPDGSLATNADGTPQYTQTQTLSGAEQQKYDLNNQVAVALDGLATNNIGKVAAAQATPFTYDGMTPLQTNVATGALNNGPSAGTAQVGPGAGAVQTNAAGGAITSANSAITGGIQSGLDYSKLSALPDPNSYGSTMQSAQDAVYQQAASRLNPQWQNNDSDLTASLAAQGISTDSDAYRRAMTTESNAKNDAYNQANYSAEQAGQAAQAQQYGQALSTQQQQQNLVDTAGNFVNNAQDQNYTENIGLANQQNAAEAQIFGQNLSNANLNNSAVDQQFTEGQTAANQANAAQQQDFSQGQAASELANTNQSTQFNEDQANAALNNSGRQEQINEAAYQRNLPLNDIAALLGTGGGVAQPDFAPVSQVGVAAPDYTGLVQSNYAQAVSTANANAQAKASALGSIFGAAGTAAGGIFSDRRLKENIKRIGTLANGLPTYAFNYIGDKAQRFGVMAQEVLGVIPDAVSYDANGMMRVDYGKVY